MSRLTYELVAGWYWVTHVPPKRLGRRMRRLWEDLMRLEVWGWACLAIAGGAAWRQAWLLAGWMMLVVGLVLVAWLDRTGAHRRAYRQAVQRRLEAQARQMPEEARRLGEEGRR